MASASVYVCLCMCTCMHRYVCQGRSEAYVPCLPQFLSALPFETRSRHWTRRILFLLTGLSRSPKEPYISSLPALVLWLQTGFLYSWAFKWGLGVWTYAVSTLPTQQFQVRFEFSFSVKETGEALFSIHRDWLCILE